jgi:hypothetical protein
LLASCEAPEVTILWRPGLPKELRTPGNYDLAAAASGIGLF